ncbi:hypothetical protein L2E82_33424 [Cichorium intybus]|uniref:Uncharacterized protein n=1 Tax=Cichorium intybus TaxID=13427 RepID=A0ACB9BK35_CICIN|nr:hypothetical protein L2E82_33424 [Cichorium intybus]
MKPNRRKFLTYIEEALDTTSCILPLSHLSLPPLHPLISVVGQIAAFIGLLFDSNTGTLPVQSCDSSAPAPSWDFWRFGRNRLQQLLIPKMASQENVKHIEDCSVSNALGTWVFSVAGALLAIPVGIKRKSLAPLVFFGTTGTMVDIIMGISACEREHAERQMKLLEQQNSLDTSTPASE